MMDNKSRKYQRLKGTWKVNPYECSVHTVRSITVMDISLGLTRAIV